MEEKDLADIGVSGSVLEQVERLALLAVSAGCHGIVASPQVATRLRQVLPAATLTVTPGIQLAGEAKSDQTRTATPAQAILAGATPHHRTVDYARHGPHRRVCIHLQRSGRALQSVMPEPSPLAVRVHKQKCRLCLFNWREQLLIQ